MEVCSRLRALDNRFASRKRGYRCVGGKIALGLSLLVSGQVFRMAIIQSVDKMLPGSDIKASTSYSSSVAALVLLKCRWVKSVVANPSL